MSYYHDDRGRGEHAPKSRKIGVLGEFLIVVFWIVGMVIAGQVLGIFR